LRNALSCIAGSPEHDTTEREIMRIAANNEIALHVPDPTAALSFYRDVLGCVVTDPNPECIALTSGALRLYLVPDPKPTHETLVPSFDVDDRDAAIRELVAKGCTLVPIGPHAPGGFYLRDPFGMLFDLVQR
jgi:catechol 2,3-dioxygenase-like lactoylglutathione lyase family enzyme